MSDKTERIFTEHLSPQETVNLFCHVTKTKMDAETKIKLSHILMEYWRAGRKCEQTMTKGQAPYGLRDEAERSQL